MNFSANFLLLGVFNATPVIQTVWKEEKNTDKSRWAGPLIKIVFAAILKYIFGPEKDAASKVRKFSR